MKTLKFSGLALALALMPTTAFAADSGVDAAANAARAAAADAANAARAATKMQSSTAATQGRNWGGRHQGRWNAGYRAPGGWAAYRRPFVGYALPRYWISPNFYVANYAGYGFAQPRAGYGWSRYYNDAVMTDSDGRVQDVITDYNWDDHGDRYEGDDDSGQRIEGKDRDGGLGGALIGAAVGAIAGNVIAGKGNHLAGTLIGGGLGALAGAAVDTGDHKGRSVEYGHDYDHAEDNVTYRDRHDGHRPHWKYRGHGYPSYGYQYYGYTYGPPMITTITFQPAPVTTTTTTTTEYVTEYVSARKRVYHAPKKRVWRAKTRCTCGS